AHRLPPTEADCLTAPANGTLTSLATRLRPVMSRSRPPFFWAAAVVGLTHSADPHARSVIRIGVALNPARASGRQVSRHRGSGASAEGASDLVCPEVSHKTGGHSGDPVRPLRLD